MARSRLRRQAWPLLAFSLAYWAWVLGAGSRKLFWFDEIISVNVVRLSDLATIWEALRQGADNNPPFYHLAARGCWLLLGEGHTAVRLPSMLGVWVLGLCLFAFVARRCGPSYGWAALLIPLSTAAAPYAYEARPYGLVLGFTGLVLFAWQAAAAGRLRGLALPGLALSLAAGVASHYYAVLLAVPLAVGELVRLRERRRVDWGVALAILAGLSVLIALRPLTRVLREQFMTNFWAQPEVLSIPRAYGFLLAHSLAALALAAILLAAVARAVAAARTEEATGGLGSHEWAVALALLAMPVYGFLMALLVTGALADRYLLPTVAGFAVALPAFVQRLAGGRRGWGTILALTFLASAPLSQYWDYRDTRHLFHRPAILLGPLMPYQDQALPIAVTNHLRFAQLSYYAPPDVARRLIYVSMGYRTGDKNLEALSRWNAMRVEQVGPFLRAHRGERLILYASLGDEAAPPLVFTAGGVLVSFIDEFAYSGTLRLP